jgi:hypothetical protein
MTLRLPGLLLLLLLLPLPGLLVAVGVVGMVLEMNRRRLLLLHLH